MLRIEIAPLGVLGMLGRVRIVDVVVCWDYFVQFGFVVSRLALP